MTNIFPEKSRRVLYRFIGWFFLINTLFGLVITASFFPHVPNYHAVVGASSNSVLLGWISLVAAMVAQTAILFFSAALVTLIVVTLIPRRGFAFFFAIILSSFLLFALIVDRVTYEIYHMHYDLIGVEVIRAGALSQVIPLSMQEHWMIAGIWIALFLIESLVIWLVWRRVRQHRPCRKGYIFAASIVSLSALSYGLNFAATRPALLDLANSHIVLETARLVPYYNEVYALLMLGDTSVRRLMTAQGNVSFQIRELNRPLAYPLHLLQCKAPQQRLNIVVIGIDTWRYDAMTPAISPNIYHFAQKALQFRNQWSGGNCTEPGLFSLFYGLPANYWHAMIKQHRGSAFIHQLLNENYQLGIFASAPLNFPAFDQTIFLDDKNLLLRTPGASTVARDREITQEFKNFLQTRNTQQPFFSFLFYDAAHNYCDSVTPNHHPFKPWVKSCARFSLTKGMDPTPYVNRYHNAVHFVDGQVQQILAALQQQGLLKNTVVILTADHGEEINDNHSGYWEHASAYDAYQLHVPMIVYWPGKSPQVYRYFTSHYDVVPTLMSQILGCENPSQDYTIGQSLFNPNPRLPLIAGSYADYAIVTPRNAMRIYPGGDYVIDNPQGQPLERAKIKKTPLDQVFELLNKYFK